MQIFQTHLCRNVPNEGLYVQLGWTGLLARSIRTFQTPIGLPQGPPFAQGGVLDVVKVVVEWWT